MKIIYPNETGNVAIMTVASKYSDDMVAAGKKFVPAGKPFLIVNENDLPNDVFFDAWEADFSNPDGIGGQE